MFLHHSFEVPYSLLLPATKEFVKVSSSTVFDLLCIFRRSKLKTGGKFLKKNLVF